MYKHLEDLIGNTPLIKLRRLCPPETTVLVKLEGHNPAGSVKDRPAYSMIHEAEKRGEIKPGDVLIEPTSGNTGIALAMVAATKGYKLTLIMPESMSKERRAAMKAFGADIILVSDAEGMEGTRDLAIEMEKEGKGKVLNQFSNPDNPLSHYTGTGPEIWHETKGKITHFVSSMGTTGTIMGAGRYFREQPTRVELIGVEPSEGSKIPGIRKWAPEYVPEIFNREEIDRLLLVSQQDAENTMRELAKQEGVFCGVSSGGCVHVALEIARETAGTDAVIVAIVCDRGDRYISTGVFPF